MCVRFIVYLIHEQDPCQHERSDPARHVHSPAFFAIRVAANGIF